MGRPAGAPFLGREKIIIRGGVCGVGGKDVGKQGGEGSAPSLRLISTKPN